MSKKDPLRLYPPLLRRKIRVPKSMGPPNAPSLFAITDDRLMAFATEWGFYMAKRQRFLSETLLERLDALREHYSVSSDIDLLLSVLFDFVPGFQVDRSERGQKKKWTEPLLIKLAVEFQRKRSQLKGRCSELRVLRMLSEEGFFKGISPDVLQNQYLRAKKLPLNFLSKWLRTTTEENRSNFIKAIEQAASDQIRI